MATRELTSDTFDAVTHDNDIVVVDFWAGWCAPCRMFAPIFERVSADHPDIVFGKVDTEAEPELAARFDVRSIPTVVVFREGVIVYADAGALPAPVLEDLVSQVRGLDMAAIRRHLEEHQEAS